MWQQLFEWKGPFTSVHTLVVIWMEFNHQREYAHVLFQLFLSFFFPFTSFVFTPLLSRSSQLLFSFFSSFFRINKRLLGGREERAGWRRGSWKREKWASGDEKQRCHPVDLLPRYYWWHEAMIRPSDKRFSLSLSLSLSFYNCLSVIFVCLFACLCV